MLFDADKRFERSDFKRSFSSFIKEINTAFWSLHNYSYQTIKRVEIICFFTLISDV